MLRILHEWAVELGVSCFREHRPTREIQRSDRGDVELLLAERRVRAWRPRPNNEQKVAAPSEMLSIFSHAAQSVIVDRPQLHARPEVVS